MGVGLCLTSVGKLLASLEITPQKLLRRACERDPLAVERWQTPAYPKLKQKAKKLGAMIFFLDEAASPDPSGSNERLSASDSVPTLPRAPSPFIIHNSSFIISPLSWRRPLWEEFYPRIRHESSPADAAMIVARHLRERVTISSLPGLSHVVPEIWRDQITDETGFAMVYVAALRSVGVPARVGQASSLSASASARAGLLVEFWDGARWENAPEKMKNEK